MYKQIDKLLPAGTTHAAPGLNSISVALWFGAALSAFIVIWLIVDAFMVWRRTHRQLSAPAQQRHPNFIIRFLRWLLYPSFQHLLGND